MDKIGDALVELVKSGVPAATKVAYLYFGLTFVQYILTVILIGGVFYFAYTLLRRWQDMEYDYTPTKCDYCGHDVKTGKYMK